MTKTRLTPDICVVGGGSAGLSLAAAASAFGVSVVLVEKGEMGGDCLNHGCVPSKSLIAAARQAHTVRQGAAFGIANVEPTIDFRAVHRHIRRAIEEIAPNDSQARFTALGVHVIADTARFLDARTMVAGSSEIRARRFVLATGSSPIIPPIPGLNSVDYLTNETIFDLKRRPAHLMVAGGGPVGTELAQAYARLGSKVTLVEAGRILGRDDPELTAVVLQQLRGEGIVIHEGTSIVSLERRGKSGLRAVTEGKDGTRTIDASHLLIATGRLANTTDLALDKAGIALDGDAIKVDAAMRTTNRRVFAIGDATGGMQFTHVANYHASQILRPLLFRLPARVDRHIIPWVTFTDPELAHVGMSEAEARARRMRVNILRWPYSQNDRAVAERCTTGFVKMVTTRGGRLLGVTIVGANAGEMINIWSLAVAKKLTMRDIAGYVVPYPTMSEIGKRAAITYFAPSTRKPSIRRLVRFLRAFG